MDLITEKTWGKVQSDLVYGSTALEVAQKLMWNLKRSLCRNYNDTADTGDGAWAVVGSGNSVTNGLDGVDRWISYSNLVWASAGSAHSWIVLKQTGIASNFQVCIDLSNASYLNATVVASWSTGFTGGSNTARPTASDEVVLLSNTAWGSSSTVYRWRVNTCKTSDGCCTRAYMSYDGEVASTWFLEAPKNPVASWTTPAITKINVIPTLTTLCNGGISCLHSGTLKNFSALSLAYEYSGGLLLLAPFYQRPDRAGSWYITSNVGLYSDHILYRGIFGYMYDIWLTVPQLISGSSLTGVGDPYAFVVLSEVIQPFDKTVIRL